MHLQLLRLGKVMLLYIEYMVNLGVNLDATSMDRSKCLLTCNVCMHITIFCGKGYEYCELGRQFGVTYATIAQVMQ